MKGIQNADQLTRRHTAFESFEDLINAPGNYRPSLQTESRNCDELRRLADLYDEAQRNRGDHRRAWRS